MGKAFNALVETTKFFETNPSKFTTGALARDKNGGYCHPSDPTADCFCTVGYMARVLGLPLSQDCESAYDFVEDFIADEERNVPGKDTLVSQNDSSDSAEEVVEILKEQLADA